MVDTAQPYEKSKSEVCPHDCHDILSGKNKNPGARQCGDCDCVFCHECKKPIAGDSYAHHIKNCDGIKK